MKSSLLFFLLFIFPALATSQELPDINIASQKNIKKLIILACYDSIPCDTQNIFVLDRTWKNANGVPPIEDQIRADTSRNKIIYDEKGRVIFTGPKNKIKHCWMDSAHCRTYRYDDKNRLIAESNYTCDKGVNKIYYHYDNEGKLILKTWYPRPDIPVTREEYYYNQEGQLDSTISWWAMYPDNPVRDTNDTKSCSIIYEYENGLITGAIADDPARCNYALFTYWYGPDNYIETSSKVVFHYVYIY